MNQSVALLDQVTKSFGAEPSRTVVLRNIDLIVQPGEFVSIVGASGGGKSTLLHLIAGLDAPTSGSVSLNGRVAMMFQEAALFPWLTARENVELALRLDGVSDRRARRVRAVELLATVHLAGHGDHRPHELSGGMRHRVALARALAQRVELLLMDEPFGALDAMTRDLMHDELESIARDRGCAVVFVTHSVREAVRLGDRVLLLGSRPGRIVAEYDVDLERPRRMESSAVSDLAAVITDRLRGEVLASVR
jgi:NitT/TauT family transport system ATP-binding protein